METEVIDAQHDPDVTNERIQQDMKEQVIKKGIAADLLDSETKYCINPSGRFVIGGPDGVSKAITARADFRWALSKLTLPHGLARVLFIEQLYRAWAVSTAHPYHRS